MPVAVRPLIEKFGHEVLDFDIASADEEQLRQLDELYRHNSLLVLRNQHLSPEQLVAFAGRFGNVLPQTAKEQALPGLPGHPGICYVSNRDAEGRPFERVNGGRWWHTDGTTLATPGLTTVLYGITTPPEGGDTLYADTCAAFNALPAETQAQLEAVRVVHSLPYLMERAAVHRPNGLTPEERAAPDVIHPMVLTNPLDGRKAFYLTSGSARGVVGMSDEDGRSFIKEWIAYVTQDQFVYRHRWQPGDVIVWNDVCTLHRATDYDETKYDRLLYRCWMTPVAA